MDAEPEPLRYGTPRGRWTLAATVLGSGIVFLDGTVVNVALPRIGEDLGASLSGMQWTVNAYLVTLSALMLLGGSLGDRFGRRSTFVAGLAGFTAASVLCGLAPSMEWLIGARALQGVGGALLVPGSLSIISASFHPDDRGTAVGAWSGLSGVSTAIGPFVGGWLIDAVSWRWIFLVNVPLAAVAIAIAIRHVPESRAPGEAPLDLGGAALVTVGLGALSYAAIEHGSSAAPASGALGAALVVAFLVHEARTPHPMLPLGMFRSPTFTGANVATLAVYAALSGSLFLLTLQLQTNLGYSALEAGAASVPFTVLMLLLSPTAGRVGTRYGPRLPMTVGPLVAAAGLLLLGRVDDTSHYWPDVAAGVVVFGLGMSITVAPLTAAVLGSVPGSFTGVASGVNNAVARFAGLVAVAALPPLAGIATDGDVGESVAAGFTTAMAIAAALCVVGGLASAVLVAGRTSEEAAAPDPRGPSGIS